MEEAGLLKERHKKMDKTFAKYRVVIPEGPLEVLEMDIKYVWITKERRYAYILAVIDLLRKQIHIESFHSILSRALGPGVFWDLWQEGKITRKVMKNKKVKFNLNTPYQQLSGNTNLRVVPC